MNSVIVGTGRMGSAIAYAMHNLGHSLSLVDQTENSFDYFKSLMGPLELDKSNVKYHAVMNIKADILGICRNADVVISALPYHQTQIVADICIENDIPYCDLGGRVDVSENINYKAAERCLSMKGKCPVFTDLGLAPGLVNILAEWGYHELGGADSIKMMVGGLPALSHVNPLSYSVTWSVDGLINEYRDDCEILKDGKIKIVKGMTEVELISTKAHETQNLEAFCTSGGAAHTIRTMHERGVSDCVYKTLRYPGHRDLVKFLIRDCELSDACLGEIFLRGCHNLGRDIVIVICSVSKGDLEWKKEFVIKSDSPGISDRKTVVPISAMQKGTAFPIASVASLIATKQMPMLGPAEYSEIPFELFNNNMEKLGIKLNADH